MVLYYKLFFLSLLAYLVYFLAYVVRCYTSRYVIKKRNSHNKTTTVFIFIFKSLTKKQNDDMTELKKCSNKLFFLKLPCAFLG